jgi:hypothetical protein
MAIGRPKPRTSGGIYNPGGENVGIVYKPQGGMYTGSGNIKPRTIKPQESEASKQRKIEAKRDADLWRQRAYERSLAKKNNK